MASSLPHSSGFLMDQINISTHLSTRPHPSSECSELVEWGIQGGERDLWENKAVLSKSFQKAKFKLEFRGNPENAKISYLDTLIMCLCNVFTCVTNTKHNFRIA